MLHHAAGSLLLHRLRALLSILGVAFGVLAFVVLVSVAESAQRDTLARIGQLGMRNVLLRASALDAAQAEDARARGSAGLSRADISLLKGTIPGIRSTGALRELRGAAEANRFGTPVIAAVTPEFMRLQGVLVLAGRAISDDDLRSRSSVCVLGKDAAHHFGSEGRLGATLRLGDAACRVVGVFRRSPGGGALTPARDLDNAVLVPLGWEAALLGDGEITELLLEFRDERLVLPSLPALRRVLAVAHRGVEDVQVVAPQELAAQARRARWNFLLLTGTIAVVCLLSGGIGIMTTMLASVTERTREIGVRRAVGASRMDILVQFASEALILTAAGAVVGLLAGLLAIAVLGSQAGFPVSASGAAMGIPVLAALLAGLLFGGYPALVAARLDPVEALRHA